MSSLGNLFGMVGLAVRRLRANLTLTLMSLLGLTVAVALIMSVPLFSDAINYNMLREELRGMSETGNRPPFAFMFRYVGAWYGGIGPDEYDSANDYVIQVAPRTIGLPLQQSVRYVKTDNFRLFPASEAQYADIRQPLAYAYLGYVTGLQDHITVIEGSWPAVAQRATDTLEVLISQKLADAAGIQVGEEYILFDKGGENSFSGRPEPAQIPIRIAGVWVPNDPTEEYWFYTPKAFEDVFFVSEESFTARVIPAGRNPIYLALWYLVFDGSGVYTENVPGLIARIVTTQSRAATVLENTSLDVSPMDAMLRYQRKAQLLTVLLLVFSVPVVFLVLYFIGLVSGMVVQRQKAEIAVLKSRGATSLQVLLLYLVEGLMVGAVALVLGAALGQLVAMVMGNTRSFLLWIWRPPLPVKMTQTAMRFGLGAVALALSASLIPALSAAGYTIVTYKQEMARSLKRPAWQRYFLDIILLVPPVYGYYVLSQRGSISFLQLGTQGSPFSEPLLFLVPALFMFAASLVFIRFFPLVMSFLAWLVQRLGNVPMVLAIRHLARSASFYTGPLLLLILTLSLAAFTGSMARTLDQHNSDSVYYRVGSDMRLVELGESTEDSEGPGTAIGGAAGGSGSQTQAAEDPLGATTVKWLFLPVTEHLRASGVRAATRVGRFGATANLGGASAQLALVGVDRVDFPRVAYWRSDFAPRSLGGLMNSLAVDTAALIVDRRFLADYAIGLGDKVRLSISASGLGGQADFTIVDYMDYFPGVYPEDGYFAVANLDYVHERIGGQVPYDVWLRTDAAYEGAEVVDNVEDVGLLVLSYDDARQLIKEYERQPERTGTFGILSVGFVTSALLTVLGFLLYSLVSFQRRFIELGILRAIGLSIGQMSAFLALEQAFLIGTGLVVGTGLGVWASSLFIQFLQVGAGKYALTPPFEVQVAWGAIANIYGVFLAMFVFAVVTMIYMLVRMRIFQAVKLGETAG
ncbi:MAG: FtsX-like permease family protein [Anaerolineae bacterium]|nr:FtsX-like permease family protein [Anaerolineae bacterium]